MRSWLRSVTAVAVRPDLWPTAVRVGVRTVPRGWWRRPPFLPRPDRAYLRFRMETQYGEAGSPRADDLVTYLAWCRDERRRHSTERPRARR